MVNLWVCGLIIYVLIGALSFNWAWKQLEPLTKVDETLS